MIHHFPLAIVLVRSQQIFIGTIVVCINSCDFYVVMLKNTMWLTYCWFVNKFYSCADWAFTFQCIFIIYGYSITVSSDTISYGYSITVSLDTYNCWCIILFGCEFIFIFRQVVLGVLLLLGMSSGLAGLFGSKLLCYGLLRGKGDLFLNPPSRMVIMVVLLPSDKHT